MSAQRCRCAIAGDLRGIGVLATVLLFERALLHLPFPVFCSRPSKLHALEPGPSCLTGEKIPMTCDFLFTFSRLLSR